MGAAVLTAALLPIFVDGCCTLSAYLRHLHYALEDRAQATISLPARDPLATG